MSPMPNLADDHAEIRNLLAQYCLLLDLDDMDSWLQLFTDDAVYEVYGHRGVGRDGIRKRESTHLTLQTAGTKGIRCRLTPRAPGVATLGAYMPAFPLSADKSVTPLDSSFMDAAAALTAELNGQQR